MLDIGKLIHRQGLRKRSCRFSSMLDIGKLIHERMLRDALFSFSSMLDIGKLILKYRSGIDRTFAVARSIME